MTSDVDADEVAREQCPHCESTDTQRQDAQFGSFAAIEYRACNACGEPYRIEYTDPVVFGE